MLFYRRFDNLKIFSGNNLDYDKTKIKDLPLTCVRNYNANIPKCFSNKRIEALKLLSPNCNLIIQKADKGPLIVLVEKNVYIRRIEKILIELQSSKMVKKKF